MTARDGSDPAPDYDPIPPEPVEFSKAPAGEDRKDESIVQLADTEG